MIRNNDQHSPLPLLHAVSEMRFAGTWTINGVFSVPQVTVGFHFIVESNGGFFSSMSFTDSNRSIRVVETESKLGLFLILILSLMVSMESPSSTTIEVIVFFWSSIGTLTHKKEFRRLPFPYSRGSLLLLVVPVLLVMLPLPLLSISSTRLAARKQRLRVYHGMWWVAVGKLLPVYS